MEKIISAAAACCIYSLSFSQNTFPANGAVGIGTTSPISILDVKGESRFSNGTFVDPHPGVGYGIKIGSNGIAVNGNSVFMNGNVGVGKLDPSYGGVVASKFSIAQTDGNSALVVGNSTTPRMALNGNTNGSWTAYDYVGNTWWEGITQNKGNVGIGTSNPQSKLTVAGDIASRKVKVTVNAGADFVFANDYKLKGLKDLEKYIATNKHLPEIASAKEMETNGIELGEMNIKLLQKVEELTLYVIEQNKKIEDQQKRLEFLENKK